MASADARFGGGEELGVVKSRANGNPNTLHKSAGSPYSNQFSGWLWNTLDHRSAGS